MLISTTNRFACVHMKASAGFWGSDLMDIILLSPSLINAFRSTQTSTSVSATFCRRSNSSGRPLWTKKQLTPNEKWLQTVIYLYRLFLSRLNSMPVIVLQMAKSINCYLCMIQWGLWADMCCYRIAMIEFIHHC